jgi:hypothetical protein
LAKLSASVSSRDVISQELFEENNSIDGLNKITKKPKKIPLKNDI